MAFLKIVTYDLYATSRNKLKTNRVAICKIVWKKKVESCRFWKKHLSRRRKVDAPFSKLRHRAKNRRNVIKPGRFSKQNVPLIFSAQGLTRHFADIVCG